MLCTLFIIATHAYILRIYHITYMTESPHNDRTHAETEVNGNSTSKERTLEPLWGVISIKINYTYI